MNTSKYIVLPALVGMVVLGSAGTAFAAENTQNNEQGKGRGQEMRFAKQREDMRGDRGSERPMDRLIGEITAISGTTLTLTVKGPEDQTKTLSVDARNAVLEKVTFTGAEAAGTKPKPTTQTISEFSVGEKVAITTDADVTENTTSVVATKVTELSGDMPERPVMKKREERASSTKAMMKDGKRGIVGEVIAISGTTLTVKAMNNTIFTVNAGDAEVKSGTTTASFSDITVGERVAVRGEKIDTTIKASMIMTDIPEKPVQDKASERGKERSFIGKVGSFFGKLFGKKAE